jgi:protein TonB
LRRILVIISIILVACAAPYEKLTGFTEADIIDVGIWDRDNYWLPTKRTAPQLPNGMFSRGIEGCASVSSVIGVDGKTYELVITRSIPTGYFDASALRAVKKFRYHPSEENNVRQPVRSNDIFAYTINGDPSYWRKQCENV